MAEVVSGVPREISPGISIGGTDWRELAVGLGIPPGISVYSGVTGNIGVIDEGGVEGLVISQNDSTSPFYAWGIDAYDGLWKDGSEILMRAYVDTVAVSGIRHKIGFGVWNDDAIPTVINDYEGVLSSTFNNDFRWHVGSGLGGVGSDTLQSAEINEDDPPGGFVPFYCWLRMRLTDEGAGLTNIKAHFSFGLDAANSPPQPAVWDINATSLGVMPQIVGANSHIGFIRTFFGPTQLSDRRWSFFSFSNDPIASPPPRPDEILDPGSNILAQTIWDPCT